MADDDLPYDDERLDAAEARWAAKSHASEEKHIQLRALLEECGVTVNDMIDWTKGWPDVDRAHLMRRLRQTFGPEDHLNSIFPSLAGNSAQQTLAVGRFKERLVQDAADALYREVKGTRTEPPLPINLTDFLAEPDEAAQYLVDRLWPAEGKIVLAAQNKAGKTTVLGNLLRSLVDGDAFLGEFKTEPVARVVLIDNELSPRMVRRWLRDQGIVNTGAVTVIPMRGRSSSFNILDPGVRAEWARLIGSADVLLFDCLRPALDALGLSEDKESGRFLEALDALAAVAGIGHLAVVHHMGHSNERSRGDSRIEDWPDAKWRLVKLDPGDGSEEQTWPRFFAAYGRDVDQREVELAYNPLDRHLSVRENGRNRAQAKASKQEEAILAYVTDHPGCSQRDVEGGVGGDVKAVRRALKALAGRGLLEIRVGKRNAHEHYLAEIAEEIVEST